MASRQTILDVFHLHFHFFSLFYSLLQITIYSLTDAQYVFLFLFVFAVWFYLLWRILSIPDDAYG